MKKLFASLLILLMLFTSLTACAEREAAEAISFTKVGETSKGTPIVEITKGMDEEDDLVMIETPESTCFSEIGYDEGYLFLTFRDSGSSYMYSDVPKSEWNGLKSAVSKGGYYNDFIKGKYTCVKIK